ncbi:MAG: ParB N-terminal domain-containing protein [Candidatus Moranbacteria bacterium]|nr:ParB N-terminal domain-containing protein [Candidatus Moranbacteria bacterium]
MGNENVHADVTMVDPARLKPNEYNPNEMSDEQFEWLLEDFRENGWIGQPVIVNGEYEIIDGFHRWKAAKTLGFDEIPVVVFEPRDGEHQKILTVALNAKRGEMSPEKLALLVTELSRTRSVEELSSKLGFSVANLKDRIAMSSVTRDFMEKIRKESERKNGSVPIVLSFAVTPEQEVVISGVLDRLSGKSRGERLFALCEAYTGE